MKPLAASCASLEAIRNFFFILFFYCCLCFADEELLPLLPEGFASEVDGISVSCGSHHTCALEYRPGIEFGGVIKCWGMALSISLTNSMLHQRVHLFRSVRVTFTLARYPLTKLYSAGVQLNMHHLESSFRSLLGSSIAVVYARIRPLFVGVKISMERATRLMESLFKSAAPGRTPAGCAPRAGRSAGG
ncbi:unnamed protein product [Heterosigma akashiwo]